MFWINDAFAKVWKIEKNDKYDDLRISTSEKDNREEGKYINSNWFARAIGKAHQQIANGEINDGDRVKIAKGKISNETYEKDGEKKSALRVLILEFGDINGGSDNTPAAKTDTKPAAKKTKKKEPEVTDISDEELPF